MALFRWDGTDFTATGVPQCSLVFTYANGATIKLNASELGNTRRFSSRHRLSGLVIGPTDEPDFANIAIRHRAGPRARLLHLRREDHAARLVAKAPACARSTARRQAHELLRAFARSDRTSGDRAGRDLPGDDRREGAPATSSDVAGGRATCVWGFPETAKGKTIRVTITVRAQGSKASRPFGAKVA